MHVMAQPVLKHLVQLTKVSLAISIADKASRKTKFWPPLHEAERRERGNMLPVQPRHDHRHTNAHTLRSVHAKQHLRTPASHSLGSVRKFRRYLGAQPKDALRIQLIYIPLVPQNIYKNGVAMFWDGLTKFLRPLERVMTVTTKPCSQHLVFNLFPGLYHELKIQLLMRPNQKDLLTASKMINWKPFAR